MATTPEGLFKEKVQKMVKEKIIYGFLKCGEGFFKKLVYLIL